MDGMRAMLDSLMGADRDAGKNEKKKSFKDDDVCKHYLVYECPHEMFVDTSGKAAAKSPIGPCRNQHSEAMKERFQQAPDRDKYRARYLAELRSTLRRLIDDLDVKIARDKKAIMGTSCSKELAETVEGGNVAREMLIKEKMVAAERMAVEGDFELSQKVVQEAEMLAKEKNHLAKVKESADTWVDEICGICGKQISWRAPEEIEARKFGRPHPHEMGSFHNGWKRAREALKEVEKTLAELRGGEGKGDSDARERSRERPRDREREKERDRDRNGDAKRDKDREGDQSRERRKSPDKGRERQNRDRPEASRQDEGYRDRRKTDRSRSARRRDDRRSRSRRDRGGGRGSR